MMTQILWIGDYYSVFLTKPFINEKFIRSFQSNNYCFSITSCRTTAFQLSDLHSLSKNQHQLLALEPVIKSNANIVAPAYYDEDVCATDNSLTVNSEGLSLFLDGFNRSNASMTIDNDIRALFENDIKENITNPYGQQYGRIVLNPKTLERKHMARHLSVINFMTLGVANLFGLNIRKYKTFIELEVEIFNANDDLIGRYLGTGELITKVNKYKKIKRTTIAWLS